MGNVRFRRLDVGLAVALLIANNAFNVSWMFKVGELRPVNVGAVYEKVKICLTCTSILLGAAGFLFSAYAGRSADHALKPDLGRAVSWLVVALLSGILTVVAMPSLGSGSDLARRHVAGWLWHYFTGPLMYICLIVGTVWFAVALRSVSDGEASRGS